MLRKYYKNDTLSIIDQPRRLPHVNFYLPKRSQYGKRASQSLTTTSEKFE